MQRRIYGRSRSQIIVERIVWNAAAVAALALMILVLLCSLRWLDHFGPRSQSAAPTVELPSVNHEQRRQPAGPKLRESLQVAELGRPDG